MRQMRWGDSIVRVRWPWKLGVVEGNLHIFLPWWGGICCALMRAIGIRQIVIGKVESAEQS